MFTADYTYKNTLKVCIGRLILSREKLKGAIILNNSYKGALL